MGIVVQHTGIIGFLDAARKLMIDLAANGFTEVGGETNFASVSLAAFEPTAAVDPLTVSQPWRLRITATDGVSGSIKLHAATPIQIPNDRSISKTSSVQESGILSTTGTGNWADGSIYYLAGAQVQAVPLSSILCISDHGIAYCLWAEGTQIHSWFVIQRPVDNVSGDPLITGKCPVFCVFSTDGGNGSAANTASQNIKRFTVREADIARPSGNVDACRHSPDYAAIINPLQQVAVSEGNNYVLTFPNGLNTSRFVYKEELDMMAYTSADVISQSATVNLTVYGEPSPRVFRALHANGAFNTGVRLLFLITGGGI